MENITIKRRIVNKHDTAENWAKAVNFIPLNAELIIYDPDDTYFYSRFKIGNGIDNVNDLPFADGFGELNSIDAGSIIDSDFEDIGSIDAGSIM